MTTLTPAEAAAIQARLTEAENAYHSLMLGTSARVFVDSNGERVEFTAANAARLFAYIKTLKFQLTGKTSTALGITIC